MNTLDKFSLDGKTAIITGCAGLLGYQHAVALLELGCNVVLTDSNPSALDICFNKLRSVFPNASIYSFTMDVTKASSIRDIASHLYSTGVRIDILINNAAVNPKVTADRAIESSSRLEELSITEWNLHMSVGLTGAFLCCQIFGAQMASDGRGGVILNISSDLSVIAPDQRLYSSTGLLGDDEPVKPVTYSVIKTGLIGLTRYVATYWAHKGIRCNALSPGGVYTDQSSDFVTRLTTLIPLQRMARKDEYRPIIQFLCSDASSYLTGQNIVMDGGRSVL